MSVLVLCSESHCSNEADDMMLIMDLTHVLPKQPVCLICATRKMPTVRLYTTAYRPERFKRAPRRDRR